jgi:hypothetical protein
MCPAGNDIWAEIQMMAGTWLGPERTQERHLNKLKAKGLRNVCLEPECEQGS